MNHNIVLPKLEESIEPQNKVKISDCINNLDMKQVKMTEFISHKHVHAIEMDRFSYLKIVDVAHAIGDVTKDGYLVCYDRGTEKEYVSWSPKQQFDNGYSVILKDNLEVPKEIEIPSSRLFVRFYVFLKKSTKSLFNKK